MRRRLTASLLLSALGAVALAGCGITDPYTRQGRQTSTVDRAPRPARSPNADPAPERGGTIPAGARAAQSRTRRRRRPAHAPGRARAVRPPVRQLERTHRRRRPARARRHLGRSGARSSATGRRQLHARPDARAERRRQQRPSRRDHPEPHDARAVGTRHLRADDRQRRLRRVCRRRCTSSTRRSLAPPSGWVVSEWAPQN